MSEPEFDSDKPDTESMFDFLAEEGTTRRAPRKPLKEGAERALPIIRKPVPISESGPLLPPKPGAPVEPPPQLTANKATSFEDDLDFLEDVQNDATVLRPETAKRSSTHTPDNVTPLRRPADSEPVHSDELDLGLDDLGLDLDDKVSFDADWREGHDSTAATGDRVAEAPGRFRGIAYLVATLLIGGGLISFFYTDLIKWTGLGSTGAGTAGNIENLSNAPESAPIGGDGSLAPSGSVGTDPSPEALVTDVGNIEPSPLMSRFRARLAELETLVLAGSLDEAEQLLSTMDRTVYGYGAFEFGEMESRISRIRSGEPVEQVMAKATQNTDDDQTVLTDESATIEQERQAAEAAQAEAARLEQERQAAEAAQAEAARLEQERQAAEAAQAEAARLEQERQAADADRRATDRRIAEERAAAQRQQARELRLQQAREREAARAQAEQLAAQQAQEDQREQERLQAQRAEALAAQQRAERQQAQSQAAQSARSNTAASEDETTVASVDQIISDDDLQLVYRRFTELQKAVRDRDINAVVSLTQRSGIRVQQFMQMFENSVEIDARIRNVSTRNATGEINGTLQIRKIRRADGSVTEAPANLASVQLSSKREPTGWSAIRW